MQEYIAMWKEYFNFSGKTNVRGYWMAWLFNFLASFALGFVDGLLGITILSSVYSLAVLIPGLAIAVRRLNDSGYSWKSLLWMLLPLVGWIIVLIRLCRPSVVTSETM